MELSQLDLAYAVTVHKAQGGEARSVVLALSPQHGRLLTRPLLYTGITRAREILLMVVGSGGHDPIATSIDNLGMETRLSTLVQRLVMKANKMSLKFHETISYYDEEDEAVPNCFPEKGSFKDNGTGNENKNIHVPPDRYAEQTDEYHVPQRTLKDALLFLNIDEETKFSIEGRDDLCGVPCVPEHVLREHIDIVRHHCTNGQASNEVIVSLVPYILIASKDYLQKSLEFSAKILETTRFRSDHGTEESLVLQLASLRHWWIHRQPNMSDKTKTLENDQ